MGATIPSPFIPPPPFRLRPCLPAPPPLPPALALFPLPTPFPSASSSSPFPILSATSPSLPSCSVHPPRPCAPSLARAFRLPFARTCASLPPLPLSSSVCFRTGAISSFFAFRISSPRPFGAQRLTAMFSVFQLQPLQPLIALQKK